jgi:hypothetical protein
VIGDSRLSISDLKHREKAHGSHVIVWMYGLGYHPKSQIENRELEIIFMG